MITNISNTRPAQIVYHFANGTKISFVWGAGSYSANHMNLKELSPNATAEDRMYESHTVECMVLEGEAMTDWIEEEYGDNPAGYIPVNSMIRIIEMADKLDMENK